MREIKGPRVWDDALGKMLYSKFEQYDDSIGFRFSEHLETESPVYMWPTEFKDKNGKEIYQMDIISWMDRTWSWYREPEKNPGKSLTDVIVFRDGSFRTDKYNELLINLVGKTGFNFLELSQVEVIGNICEHPHLREVETT